MPANIDPVYSKRGMIAQLAGGTSLAFKVSTSTANTALDGTGTLDTSIWAAFECLTSANGGNGAFLRSLNVKMTAGAGASTATVLRFFLNNGSTNGTATNNGLWKEMTLPSITGSQVAAMPDYEIPCNILLPAGWRVLYTFGTAPTNTYMVFGIGGEL